MFHTEKMTEEMHDEILAMVEGFYAQRCSESSRRQKKLGADF